MHLTTLLAVWLLPGLTFAWPADAKRGVDCGFSTTIENGATCESFANSWGISVKELELLNPGITCPEPEADTAYCVIGTVNDNPPTTTTTSKTSPSFSTRNTSTDMRSSIPSSPPATRSSFTTKTESPTGITTPQPTQPGMTSNCNKFYFVQSGVDCGQVLNNAKVSLADLFKWNPSVLEDCTGLWASVNVCVGIIGATTSTTRQNPSPTTRTGQSAETPSPVQAEMVSNCGKFFFVEKGMTCAQVLSGAKVLLSDMYKWNPSIQADCSGLWADVNVCVGLTDSPGAMTKSTATSKPTTTKSVANGVETPQPTQPGMITTCKKFHWVAKGVTCGQILSYNKISMTEFYKWNPGVSSDCTSMWAETYVCVGI